MPLRNLSPTLLPRLALVTALALAPAVARAQASMEETQCLRQYATTLRTDATKALADLRACATKFPQSFTIRRTLGRRLLDLAAKAPAGSAEAAQLDAEGIAEIEKAATAEPVKLGIDWLALADAYARAGRTADVIKTLERAAPHLSGEERQQLDDRRWPLLLAEGRKDEALALWKELAPRRWDDREAQLAAARLLAEAGELDAARGAYERALDLQPEDPATREAFMAVIARLAKTGSSADKRLLVEFWLPKLGSAEDAMLADLLGYARDVLWPEASKSIAQEVVRRQPDHAEANVLLAESDFEADEVSAARGRAERVLAASPDAAVAARAHAVVGKAMRDQAYAAYASGSGAAGTRVQVATAAFREARRHLEKAQAGGASVAADIESLDDTMKLLEQAKEVIVTATQEAGEEVCRKLANLARYQYDLDKPIKRVASGSVPLARQAGHRESVATLEPGTEVSVLNASWTGGECWLNVKSAAGTAGWAPDSKLREK